METIEAYKGFNINVDTDEYPADFFDCDRATLFVAWHRKYTLETPGTEKDFPNVEAFQSWLKRPENRGSIVMPWIMYEHGCIGFSTTRAQYPFNCPWDSGQLGYLVMTPKEMRASFVVKRITKATREKAERLMLAELHEYECIVQGDVVCYLVQDAEGNVIDSCGGFVDFSASKNYILECARNAIDHEIENARQAAIAC